MSAAAVSCLEQDRPTSDDPVRTRRTRLVWVAASYALIGLGVGLLIRADLGVAPFDVLNTGVAESLGVRFGVAFAITSVICFGSGILLGGRAGWASLVGTIVIAPLVELALVTLPEPEALAGRIPMFLVGVLVLVTGVCLVVTTELGPGPGEVLMLGFVARGIRVAPARWLTDGMAFVAGVALGGAAGAGTVVFAFVFGPLVAGGLRVLRYSPPVNVAGDVVSR